MTNSLGLVRAWIVLFMAVSVIDGTASTASAQERRTPEEVIAMVEAAIAHYDAVGREQALASFNDPAGAFVDGEIYIGVMTIEDPVIVANPHAHHLINLPGTIDLVDVNGVPFLQEVLQSAVDQPDGAWVEYVWVNPANDVQETKRTYVRQHDGLTIISGYYVSD